MVCFSLDLSSMDTLDLLELGGYFLLHFREGFLYYLFKYFLMPLLLSSGMPMIWMLGWLTLSQMSLRLSSFLFILFSLFCYALLFPPFYLPAHLSILLLQFLTVSYLQNVFNLCYHVVYWWLYIIYLFQSLLNIYCNFLIHASFYLAAPPFYFWDFGSSLLSFFWILFQVDCIFPCHLFGLVEFYHVPSSAPCFSVFSFYLIYCVWGLLSAG